MINPFRQSAKPFVEKEPPPVSKKPSYPRLIKETPGSLSRRLVEVEKGVYVVEKLVIGKDSMGADSNFWLEEAKIKDDVASYQCSVDAKIVVWLIRQLDVKNG